MNTSALPADSGRPYPPRPRTPAVVGRRTVLSGVLSLAAGAALRPTTSTAAGGLATGATIYSYGHSYTVMPSPYVTWPQHDEYQLQLGRRLASGPVISRGRSGTRMLDTISAIIAPTFAGSTGRRWRIGDKGIVLLHNMMNDVAAPVGGVPDYLNAYEKSLRPVLGVFGARSFTHADRASRIGGGWRVNGTHRVENGRTWFTQTYGDKISFMVTGGDSVHVSTLCTDPALLTQGTLRAEGNGVVLGFFGRARPRQSTARTRAALSPMSLPIAPGFVNVGLCTQTPSTTWRPLPDMLVPSGVSRCTLNGRTSVTCAT